MRYLESDRLLLKPIEEEDIEKLLQLRWDKEIMQYLRHEPISRQQQLEWFRKLTANDLALSIFLKERGETELIGTAGLYGIDRKNQLASWNLRLSRTAQGKGLGYESAWLMLDYGFNTHNLRKVQGNSFTANEALTRLSHKLGFKEEGRLREHYYHDGAFREVIVWGLLKAEFPGYSGGMTTPR